jgi:hypothetical protein
MSCRKLILLAKNIILKIYKIQTFPVIFVKRFLENVNATGYFIFILQNTPIYPENIIAPLISI